MTRAADALAIDRDPVYGNPPGARIDTPVLS
jgi:hypothetical protein